MKGLQGHRYARRGGCYPRGLRIATLVILSSILQACGGGGAGGKSPTPVTSVAPQGSPVVTILAPSSAQGYATVTLDGSASSDTKSSITAYSWTQTAGPTVAIANASTAAASFVAPSVAANTALTFSLSITDALATTAASTVTLTVTPPDPTQATASFVAMDFERLVTGDPHNDAVPIDSAPESGESLLLHMSLGGTVATATFSFLTASGGSLGPASLVQTSNGATPPLDFYGTVTVPAVPFLVAVTGTMGNGSSFKLTSPATITPLAMTLGFTPRRLSLAPGATGSTTLNITNAGAAATFIVVARDTNQLATPALNTSVQIAQGQTATIPIKITFPALSGILLPRLVASVTVPGDATRTASTTFTAIRNGAP